MSEAGMGFDFLLLLCNFTPINRNFTVIPDLIGDQTIG